MTTEIHSSMMIKCPDMIIRFVSQTIVACNLTRAWDGVTLTLIEAREQSILYVTHSAWQALVEVTYYYENMFSDEVEYAFEGTRMRCTNFNLDSPASFMGSQDKFTDRTVTFDLVVVETKGAVLPEGDN